MPFLVHHRNFRFLTPSHPNREFRSRCVTVFYITSDYEIDLLEDPNFATKRGVYRTGTSVFFFAVTFSVFFFAVTFIF